ncbi:MAG: single-stranded DNA-binding protein [Treponema sp.]|nr:single-stranded DNA-binding protein [Treponema sp.]
MNSLNQIILEGNVCRQPELRQSAAGNYVCVMPLAVNRSYKNANGEHTAEVSFFDVATFGKTAEVCGKYATIGRHIRVVGRLKQDRWKNQEGKSMSKVNIIAEHVELLSLPRNQDDDSSSRAFAERKARIEETLVATNAAAASQQLDEIAEADELPAF